MNWLMASDCYRLLLCAIHPLHFGVAGEGEGEGIGKEGRKHDTQGEWRKGAWKGEKQN